MLFAATWMDLVCWTYDGPSMMDLSYLVKSERQIPYDITYMWNLKYSTMNIFSKQKQTRRQREQTCGC